MTFRKLFAVPLTALVLAGCTATTNDRYPSLATRDIERAEGTFEPVETAQLEVPPVEVDRGANLAERLAALVEQARDAHAGFVEAIPGAEKRVSSAAGSSVGSDAWAAAQVALADLDSARSTAAIALGDLDILFAATTVEAGDAGDIVAARESVIALVAKEDTVLERLRAQIR